MIPDAINSNLTKYSSKLIRSYIGFPADKPVTALDLRAGSGESLIEITRPAGESFLYGISSNRYEFMKAQEKFHKVSNSDYKRQAKISNDVFSVVVANPFIHSYFLDQLFNGFDKFIIPDFESQERERLLAIEATKHQLDLGTENISEEKAEEARKLLEEKIQKATDDRQIAYRRTIREQEKKTEAYRDDKFVLANATKYLAPGGLLIFVTPKEFIDSQIVFKLANNFEDIKIYRLDDDEYQDQRKCIIFARKRRRTQKQASLPYELMQNKFKPYKEIEVLSLQQAPLYQVPSFSSDDVQFFRVGDVTPEELSLIMNKSLLYNNVRASYTATLQSEVPKPPTQLHKGHVSLTLASGLLNGYIGTGADRHLVKGSVHKKTAEVVDEEENEDGELEIKNVKRDYFDIQIKYLDRSGEFHTLL